MNQTVTLEVFYPHCQERVWQALTERQALAAWMMDNNFEPRLGHKFHFRQVDVFGLTRCIHCEVIELEPPNRLAYRWQEAQTEEATIVTWTLKRVADGTTLQLRHHQLACASAISPSVLWQQLGQSAVRNQPRAVLDSMPSALAAKSPTSVIMGDAGNDCSRMQLSGSTFPIPKSNLELQAQWHQWLSGLEQQLGDRFST